MLCHFIISGALACNELIIYLVTTESRPLFWDKRGQLGLSVDSLVLNVWRIYLKEILLGEGPLEKDGSVVGIPDRVKRQVLPMRFSSFLIHPCYHNIQFLCIISAIS